MSLTEPEIFLVEGVVESDPITNYCTIRTTLDDKPYSIDVQGALRLYAGREIRFVLAPLATIQELEDEVARRNKEAESQGLPPLVEAVDGFPKGN